MVTHYTDISITVTVNGLHIIDLPTGVVVLPDKSRLDNSLLYTLELSKDFGAKPCHCPATAQEGIRVINIVFSMASVPQEDLPSSSPTHLITGGSSYLHFLPTDAIY